MARYSKTYHKTDESCACQGQILLYGKRENNLEDYASTLKHYGVDFEMVHSSKEAKELLKTGRFGILIADVTAFEETGRSLIAWTKHHIQIPGFKTHGYSATETPSVIRRIYYCGPDQRFFFSHTDIDHLTGLLYGLFTDHPELKWIQELVSRRQNFRSGIMKDSFAANTPILLHGAKGLGKECLAQLVHGRSERKDYEFIVLDCNPRQRFDYAYQFQKDTPKNRERLRTHFMQMLGLAYRGTLFVRSFCHLSVMAQDVLNDVIAKGVCILPDKDIEREFKGRIFFSTNKSLPEMVKAKTVSSKLYGTLMQSIIEIPPLACFKDDMVNMAQSIIDHQCLKARGKTMTIKKDAMNYIFNHPWPGNIEEMYEVLEIALTTADNLVIRSKDLPFVSTTIVEDKEGILEAMYLANGNKSKAAKLIGRGRTKFYALLNDHNITDDIITEYINRRKREAANTNP